MKIRNYALIGAAALLMAFGSVSESSAAAKDVKDSGHGIFLGAGAGAALQDGDLDDFAWRLHLWTNFFTYLHAEIGYMDAHDVDGFMATAGPTIGVGEHGRAFLLGGTIIHTENDIEDNSDDTKVDWTFGAGFAYDLFPDQNVGIRADWQRLQVDNKVAIAARGTDSGFTEESEPIDTFMLSIYWHAAP